MSIGVPGDRVECFRASTPEKVEWTGVIDRIRHGCGIIVVSVDNLVVRHGTLKGQPIRVAFSAKGERMGSAGQAPPFMIRAFPSGAGHELGAPKN